jgi:DoxX-like protein
MSITLLRWSLALVLGSGAALLLISLVHGGHPGIPSPLAAAVGLAELAGAILFVAPRTTTLGAIGLVASLAAAAIVHVAVGDAPPPAFLVYAAGIAVIVRTSRGAGVVS